MTPRIAEIAAFMRARHQIYLDRAAGLPGPWTLDPILSTGRFCNIFRELDTVTIWIRKHIREPYADHPNLWLMLAIARYINWPPTLARLFDVGAMPTQDRWHPELLTAGLEAIAADGKKVYTGAYMIRAESDPNKEWFHWSKHRYIAEIVVGRLWEDREMWNWLLDNGPGKRMELSRGFGSVVQLERKNPRPSLEEVWELFQSPHYIGWGPFMAYEVVTDMRHTRYLRDAPDIMTWANAGPGAIRGLNRLYGRPLKAQPKKDQTCTEMIMLLGQLNRSRNTDGALWPKDWPKLEMRDVEHTLCEFDKYERVKAGEGQMRAKYDWRKATDLSK